jgi:hypothetical protein
MVAPSINRAIVNGYDNTLNVETTLDTTISVNGRNNIINQSLVEGEYTEWTEIDNSPLTYSGASHLGNVCIDDKADYATLYLFLSGGVTALSSITLNPPSIIETVNALPISIIETHVAGSVLNKYIVSVDANGDLKIYKAGILKQTISGFTESGLLAGIAVSPRGKYIFLMYDGLLHIYKGS